MNKPPPFIVCAANRKDGIIVTGARHFDSIMRNVINALNVGYGGWEQGFIDQYGQFYTRKEAWVIADKNGQIRRETGYEAFLDKPRTPNVGDVELLFSENLY